MAQKPTISRIVIAKRLEGTTIIECPALVTAVEGEGETPNLSLSIFEPGRSGSLAETGVVHEDSEDTVSLRAWRWNWPVRVD